MGPRCGIQGYGGAEVNRLVIFDQSCADLADGARGTTDGDQFTAVCIDFKGDDLSALDKGILVGSIEFGWITVVKGWELHRENLGNGYRVGIGRERATVMETPNSPIWLGRFGMTNESHPPTRTGPKALDVSLIPEDREASSFRQDALWIGEGKPTSRFFASRSSIAAGSRCRGPSSETGDLRPRSAWSSEQFPPRAPRHPAPVRPRPIRVQARDLGRRPRDEE